MRQCGLGMRSYLVKFSQVSCIIMHCTASSPVSTISIVSTKMVVQHTFKSWDLVQWDGWSFNQYEQVVASCCCCCWSWDFIKTLFCHSWIITASEKSGDRLMIPIHGPPHSGDLYIHCTLALILYYSKLKTNIRVEFQARKHNLETHVIEERPYYDKVGVLRILGPKLVVLTITGWVPPVRVAANHMDYGWLPDALLLLGGPFIATTQLF